LKVSKQMLQAGTGIFLLVLALPLSFYSSRHYTEKRYIVDASSCRLNVLALQRADLPEIPEAENGSVVLFHGIAANAVIMQYLARGFAELGMRVYLPDLPGHGHSPGPFSPELAESCSAALLRGLAARGMIVPDRTILAGHSMGGAIALRVADKFRPAGVIAISPAPMEPRRGVEPQNLLFHGAPRILPNTRILVGQFEPAWMKNNAADLAASTPDRSVIFSVVPWNSHVSVLFSPSVAMACQAWAARVLWLPETTRLPFRGRLLACVMGLVGILLVAGPFLRDLLGKELHSDLATAPAAPWWRGALEMIVISLAVVFLLHHWLPLRFLHLFEGDYLASFFLLVGLILMIAHFRAARNQLIAPAPSRPAANEDLGKTSAPPSPAPLTILIGTAVAALLLHFLVTSWFELTASSAWLTLVRWERFPVFFLVAFLFLYALELLAGPVGERPRIRYVFWLLLVALAWHSLALGVFHLKSGEILLVLLSPYIALQFLLSGLGVQLVRRLTGSATAAALFGAILLAGFCLVLFPVT
jgi:pimeloyl-ACP methyl ester carboxylesterase